MGFFYKILGGNDSQTIVRCDEAEFLIWKYQEVPQSGTFIIVKDGEVAVLQALHRQQSKDRLTRQLMKTSARCFSSTLLAVT